MIREVYIDGILVDANVDAAVDLIFESPVFSDISKIKSNGTSTYRLPMTQHNLNIFNIPDKADFISDFPYKYHTFEEYRNGIPIIQKGICKLLEISDNIELQVLWGNQVNLISLLDMKLTDLQGFSDLEYNQYTSFLSEISIAESGFLKVDFGKGVDYVKDVNPFVRMSSLITKISQNTGVSFDFPGQLHSVFRSKWISLVDSKSNYQANSRVRVVYDSIYGGFTILSLQHITGTANFSILKNGSFYFTTKGHAKLTFNLEINFRTSDNMKIDLVKFENSVTNSTTLQTYTMTKVSGTMNQRCSFVYELDYDGTETPFHISMRVLTTNNQTTSLWDPLNSYGTIEVQENTVSLSRPYPIAQNLPDIKCVDFIKFIMHMFCLFAYYDVDKPNTVIFISIEEIYQRKQNAKDWSKKFIETKSISRTFNDYAQRNYFRYKKDETVLIDASDFLSIENETLLPSKDIVELPFAASDNVTDTDGNVYSFIRYYNEKGDKSKIEPRILTESIYKSGSIRYKSGFFDESLMFSGINGILNQYYTAYQQIIQKPVSVEDIFYLSETDISEFDEITPIFRDGTYYMPIKVSISTNGVSTCKLLRMPYRK